MRKITTVDGKVYSGFNSEFKDKGTHVEKKGLFSKDRIYKENIATDRETNTAGAVVSSAAIATLTGGMLM